MLYSRKFFGVILTILLLSSLGLATGLANKPVTNRFDLPPELGAKDTKKFTLLDFYAEWCGTCKMMEPEIESIEKESGSKLQVVKLDVDLNNNDKYNRRYHIDGTPTYILFNAQGKQVYEMRDWVSAIVLRYHVLKQLGKLPITPLPNNAIKAVKSPYLMVSIQNASCNQCQSAEKLLFHLKKAHSSKLTVIELDPKQPEVKNYLNRASIKTLPAYQLMDRQQHSLFFVEGPLNNGSRQYEAFKGITELFVRS